MCFSATISASHVLTLQTYISYYIKWGGGYQQCDQTGHFIGLWATFQSLWQQLICPNLPHSLAIFVKVLKSITWKNATTTRLVSTHKPSENNIPLLRSIQTAAKFAVNLHVAVADTGAVPHKIEKALIFCTTTVCWSHMSFLSNLNEPFQAINLSS